MPSSSAGGDYAAGGDYYFLLFLTFGFDQVTFVPMNAKDGQSRPVMQGAR